MGITPEENVAALEAILVRAALGAAVAANAMAEYIADRVASDTLRRTTHAPGAYYKARPGAPPASASGTLAKSMYVRPASGGLRASAYAGNDARHARMLEFGGCVLKPRAGKTMKWKDTGRETHWHHARLPADQDEFPAHPFIGPTTDEAIDDGELQRIAIEAFRDYDP